MNLILLTLTVAGLSAPDWDYIGEPTPPHYIHVVRNGVDLGRAASGTFYSGDGTSVFVADSIAVRHFE